MPDRTTMSSAHVGNLLAALRKLADGEYPYGVIEVRSSDAYALVDKLERLRAELQEYRDRCGDLPCPPEETP